MDLDFPSDCAISFEPGHAHPLSDEIQIEAAHQPRRWSRFRFYPMYLCPRVSLRNRVSFCIYINVYIYNNNNNKERKIRITKATIVDCFFFFLEHGNIKYNEKLLS